MLSFACIFFTPSFAQQTQEAHANTRINDEINGYYVAKPDDYDAVGNSAKKYPLLIIIEGLSEMGNGSPYVDINHPGELIYLLGAWGSAPYLIDKGSFPTKFFDATTNSDFKFIIFTPQFRIPSTINPLYQNNPYLQDSAIGFPGADISAVIEYCKTNYRVNTDRIYLAGNSSGGGQVWSYLFSSPTNAKKIAAAVIMSGASYPLAERAAIINSGKVAVLATYASMDPVVPPSWTENWIDTINNYSVPSPLYPAKSVKFVGSNHSDASIGTYNPASDYDLIDGLNMYQWLLKYDRANPLPVSDIDLSVITKNSGFEIAWKTQTEINNKGFYLEVSSNGIDFKSVVFIPSKGNSNIGFAYTYSYEHPIQGKNYFRLKQVNKDNSFVYSDINVAEYRMPHVINVFPNPVKDVLTLKVSFQFANAHLEINDMNGKTVKVQNFSGNNASISVNELAKGVYHGTVAQDKDVYSFTFVKQ